jgi:hypothetical protein
MSSKVLSTGVTAKDLYIYKVVGAAPKTPNSRIVQSLNNFLKVSSFSTNEDEI